MLTGWVIPDDIVDMTASAKLGAEASRDAVHGRLLEAAREAGFDPDQRGGQVEVARACGIPQAQMHRYITNKAGMSPETLVRVAIGLQVRPGWLAFGEPPMKLSTSVEPGTDPAHLLELALSSIRNERR